ncbi:hypothetical protein UA08_05738 [Talaromyces atroroseus]|uniref:Zn(2)-C6 fungal-type domain-containing protein n=1 Tax=Talaromyces atroroseus TaxID=1441469 RepID=A0A225AT84_TALAT|nr:hypothetical protein UA08_05738 [Talaromyces atroroseus]OKL58809.1 hypothetical protein UA08_05738 [Talaromyces atroroseus]
MADLNQSGMRPAVKGSRRSHTKSRAGCQRCKARRVKCDEARPVCRNCEKSSLRCDFSPALARAGPQQQAIGKRGRGRPRRDWESIIAELPMRNASCSLPAQETAESPSSGSAVTPCLNVDDLELFYHYLNHRCLKRSGEHMWHVKVPQLGFQHPYVLHLILAMAAFHLVHLAPPDSDVARFEGLADHHYEAGLREVSRLIPSINRHNLVSLYVATVLICLITCAKRPSPGHLLLVAEGQEVSWWQLLRGVRYMRDLDVHGLQLSFHTEESTEEQPHATTRPVHWERPLDGISKFIAQEATSPGKEVYEKALADLSGCFRDSFGTASQPKEGSGVDGEFQFIMGWVYRTEEDFVLCLKNQQPISLIILAYFSVLIKTLEYEWFMQGWASHILEGVGERLRIEYRHWLDWPAEQIREIEAFRQQNN